MSVPDGQHRSGYDSSVSKQLVAEAANVVRGLGFASQHVVLIGGLVPGLLVPELDPGIEPHVGTADIDRCLSVALVDGDTGTYQRIERVLKELGFDESDTSFRWRRSEGLHIAVEFFCPAGEDRPAGRVFRPKVNDNDTAKHNMGGKLSALALEAGELLTRDFEEVTVKVDLPDDKGVVNATLRVTGPVAFLVAKSHALVGPAARDKPKDAYDIIWLIESWPGGPDAAAAEFATRPAFFDDSVTFAISALGEAFADTRQVGARSYARFAARDVREEARLARRAVGAVAEFLRALPAR